MGMLMAVMSAVQSVNAGKAKEAAYKEMQIVKPLQQKTKRSKERND